MVAGRPLTERDRAGSLWPVAAGEHVPETWRAERPRTVVVDGHDFLVRPRPAEPGTYDFDWTSGPNAGYGFAISGWQGRPLSADEIRGHIRDFLQGIDPRTGYLE